MKILLAGGSGLIGRGLSSRLLAEGHTLWVLSRTPPAHLPYTEAVSNLSWVQWDGRTVSGWGQLASEVDVVINLAGTNIGEGRWTRQRKHAIRFSRIEAGQALLEAISHAAHRPSLFLQIAGVGYYGPHGDEPLNECAPAGNDFLAGVARDWEQTASPVQDLGVRYVIMRTGVVLSRHGGVLNPFLLQNRLFVGGPLGSGNQWISWIHEADLIHCFLFLLSLSDSQGVYNVTSPQPVTNTEFGRTLSGLMRRPYWAPAPAFMLRLVLGEMSTLVLDGQKVIPERLLVSGFQYRFADLRSALLDLLEQKTL